MKSSFCIDLQRFMLIPTKFPLSPFFFPDISYKKTPNSTLQYSGRTFSDPDGIQTHDLQNRNLTLYSAKLRGHNK